MIGHLIGKLGKTQAFFVFRKLKIKHMKYIIWGAILAAILLAVYLAIDAITPVLF